MSHPNIVEHLVRRTAAAHLQPAFEPLLEGWVDDPAGAARQAAGAWDAVAGQGKWADRADLEVHATETPREIVVPAEGVPMMRVQGFAQYTFELAPLLAEAIKVGTHVPESAAEIGKHVLGILVGGSLEVRRSVRNPLTRWFYEDATRVRKFRDAQFVYNNWVSHHPDVAKLRRQGYFVERFVATYLSTSLEWSLSAIAFNLEVDLSKDSAAVPRMLRRMGLPNAR